MDKLSLEQQLVITQLLESNKLLTEQGATAISNTAIIGGVGTGTMATGGATYGIAQTSFLAGATAAASPVIVPTALILGGVVLLGGAIYGVVELGIAIRANKYRAADLKKHVEYYIEQNIWRNYFKDEIQNARDRKNIQSYSMDREHPAITEYTKYLTESIAEIDQINDPEFQQKIKRYREIALDFIQPKYILAFHTELRIWCAYHQVGEFAPKDTSWHSSIWYEREELKLRMFECFKDELKFQETPWWEVVYPQNRFSKNEKDQFVQDNKGIFQKTSWDFKWSEFKVIRNKLYRIFNAMEYLRTQDFNEQQYCEITKDWGESVLERIDSKKRAEFKLLFRKYRYLGGKGEFNRENVLNSRYYHEMYAYVLKDWNNQKNGSFAKNITEIAGATATLTFILEFGLIVMGLQTLEEVQLSQACASGVEDACNTLIEMQTQEEMHSMAAMFSDI
jgi:hypothetical protein